MGGCRTCCVFTDDTAGGYPPHFCKHGMVPGIANRNHYDVAVEKALFDFAVPGWRFTTSRRWTVLAEDTDRLSRELRKMCNNSKYMYVSKVYYIMLARTAIKTDSSSRSMKNEDVNTLRVFFCALPPPFLFGQVVCWFYRSAQCSLTATSCFNTVLYQVTCVPFVRMRTYKSSCRLLTESVRHCTRWLSLSSDGFCQYLHPQSQNLVVFSFGSQFLSFDLLDRSCKRCSELNCMLSTSILLHPNRTTAQCFSR